MKIYNVADLPDEFGSCVEYKNGKYTSTQPIYLCSECYEKLFQAMCENDIDESMLANDTEMKQIFDQKE